MRIVRIRENIQRWLRRLLGVLSIDEVAERERQWAKNLAEHHTNRLDMQYRSRDKRLQEHERRLDKLFAEVERVASQTTLAVDDMLTVLVSARKEWQAAQKKEQEKEKGGQA